MKPQKNRDWLTKNGIHSDWDLLLYLPLRYEDLTQITPIGALKQLLNKNQIHHQVEGVAHDMTVNFVGTKKSISLILRCSHRSGTLTLRFIHTYPSMITSLQKAVSEQSLIRAYGEVRQHLYGLEMIHPQWSVVNSQTALPKHLTPIYPSLGRMPQNYIRKVIQGILVKQTIEETLPVDELQKLFTKTPFISLNEALQVLHHPKPTDVALASSNYAPNRMTLAQQKLKFEEAVAQQLSVQKAVQIRSNQQAQPIPALEPHQTQQFLHHVGFTLTAAQKRVCDEISKDLAQSYPMHRLLQGDVGSGKTIVAALAALPCLSKRGQVALMVPTEILAEQHFHKFSSWLSSINLKPTLLTGSLKKAEKQRALEQIANGEATFIIGTHAMIQKGVHFNQLLLVIIDEQHRFGVSQRYDLLRKSTNELKNVQPHQLVMSATPIPRTLAIAYYGDLSVSVIDELPPNRKPIQTVLIEQKRREEVIERIRLVLSMGEQVYWVCPLIEDSETLQLETAESIYKQLSAQLPEFRVGLLHGRLKSPDRNTIMTLFKNHEIDLLVATTVIEVGVDVPNASWMIIENAERFGLSQLHQLRGRVGRGAKASYCILLYQSPLSTTARERLKVMRSSQDGFLIAKADLKIRGPGELLGERQSGHQPFKFIDLQQDEELMVIAQKIAQWLWQHHPTLAQQHINRWLGKKAEWLLA